MNLFEFEGKAILRECGVPIPDNQMVYTEAEMVEIDYPFVLKAQVMAGGRGKAGGIRACQNEDDYIRNAHEILNMQIKGHQVCGILVEKMIDIQKELYLAITLQGVSKPTLIFSSMGGMNIEEIARLHPERIIKVEIDPYVRLKEYQLRSLAEKIPDIDKEDFIQIVKKVEGIFFSSGALLVEINPLGVVDGKLMALDAKFALDDHASKTSNTVKKIMEGRCRLHNYVESEREKTTVTYVPLNGDIALISDGAGTGMLTLDMVYEQKGALACFCELGGMTTEDVMYRALELALDKHPGVKSVIIVLIGGFNRMDNMARGIVQYVKDHAVKIPIFTRMCGTMEAEGIQIMSDAGIPTYYDLTETVQLATKAARGD